MYFQRPVSTGLGQELGLAVAEIIIISAHVTKVYKWSLGEKNEVGFDQMQSDLIECTVLNVFMQCDNQIKLFILA